MSLWDSITVDSRQLQGREKKQYGSVADNLGPGLVNNLKSNNTAVKSGGEIITLYDVKLFLT